MTAQFLVQDRGGAFTTDTVRGCRASSTFSALAAAEAMGRKLFGVSLMVAYETRSRRSASTTWW